MRKRGQMNWITECSFKCFSYNDLSLPTPSHPYLLPSNEILLKTQVLM